MFLELQDELGKRVPYFVRKFSQNGFNAAESTTNKKRRAIAKMLFGYAWRNSKSRTKFGIDFQTKFWTKRTTVQDPNILTKTPFPIQQPFISWRWKRPLHGNPYKNKYIPTPQPKKSNMFWLIWKRRPWLLQISCWGWGHLLFLRTLSLMYTCHGKMTRGEILGQFLEHITCVKCCCQRHAARFGLQGRFNPKGGTWAKPLGNMHFIATCWHAMYWCAISLKRCWPT